MTDVCVTAPPSDFELFTSFSAAALSLGLPADTLYNLFAGATADQGTQGILQQVQQLVPKEDQPDYIHKYDYTGTDYTEVVQEAASAVNEFFGSNVEVFSADGSIIFDSNYTEYLVNAAIALGANISYEIAATVSGEARDEVRAQIAELVSGAQQLSAAACLAEYPFNPDYLGLAQRCQEGDIPVYPWFSKTTSRTINLLNGDFDGIPPECLPGTSESCGLFGFENPSPSNEDRFSIADYHFVLADRATTLGTDANCYLESYIVGAVASIVASYLPFCGVGNQNIQIYAAMMGYYFGATGGGKYCVNQPKDLILEKLVLDHSMCEFGPWDTIDWYSKPCALMNAYDLGFSLAEDGASLECLYDSLDFAAFEDCTTDPDYCPINAPNGCSPKSEFDDTVCAAAPANYDGACPAPSAAAGGLPAMMTFYATAFLWVLQKFAF